MATVWIRHSCSQSASFSSSTVKVSKHRTGSGSLSPGTATNICVAPTSIPAASGSITGKGATLLRLLGMNLLLVCPASARAVRKSSLPNEIILASIRNESVITALSTGPGTTLVVGLLKAPLSPRSLLRTQGAYQRTHSLEAHAVPYLFVQTNRLVSHWWRPTRSRNSRPELVATMGRRVFFRRAL